MPLSRRFFLHKGALAVAGTAALPISSSGRFWLKPPPHRAAASLSSFSAARPTASTS